MRIALICTDKGPCPPVKGGAIQLLISRIAPLLAKKHNVTVFSITDPNLPKRERVKGVTYIRYPKDNFFKRVCLRAKKERFDIIQVYNRPTWITPLRKSAPNSNILLSLHNMLYKTLKVGKVEATTSMKDVDYIQTVSQFIEKDTIKKTPEVKGKIKVFYTGVDLNEYEPVWTKRGYRWRKEIREQYSINEKDPVILFVGRLVSYKGCHLLIDAMKSIIKKHKNAKLIVVGSKWYADDSKSNYMDELKRKAKKIGCHVIFTSYVPVDEIPKYFAASDIFVCASQWQEPLARVHYEAMAAGIPIITTRRGGNYEVIKEGFNGLVLKKYDVPDKYVEVINKLLSKPKVAQTMGRNGRKLVENIYNFKRYTDELESLYVSLFSKKRK